MKKSHKGSQVTPLFKKVFLEDYPDDKQILSGKKALQDITNYHNMDITPQFIDTSYNNAKESLLQAEQNGERISIQIYDDLDDLKRSNEKKVLEIQGILNKLETIDKENQRLSEQLKLKNQRIGYLKEVEASFESYHDPSGNDFTTASWPKQHYRDNLAKYRIEHDELQKALARVQSEIAKVQKMLSQKESETRELSDNIKEMINKRNCKDEDITRTEANIAESADKLLELQHKVHSLRNKNNGREAEINRMIQEADDLMKKYTGLKEKSLKFKEKMLDNFLVTSTTVGSKLLFYRLSNILDSRSKSTLNTIMSFSRFDEKFFLSLKR